MAADYSSISSSSNDSLISFDKSFSLLQMSADLKKGANSSIYRAVLAAVKQEEERTKQYLANDPEWSQVANNLSVDIANDGQLEYKFSGSVEDANRVKELEYGGPGQAPRGTIRKLKYSSAGKIDKVIDSALSRFLK